MPTYVYKFIDTADTVEVQQAFTDDALTEAVHPGTGETMPVKKVFLPVGVSFKGGGFYKTDSRGGSGSSSSAAASSSNAASSNGSNGSTDSGSSGSPSPATATPAASSSTPAASSSTPSPTSNGSPRASAD